MNIDEKLGDGSWCIVEPVATRTVTISRVIEHGSEKGDETVWGQVFDTGPIDESEWPGPRVWEVVEAMRDMPSAFDRRTLWDANGKAVTA